MRLLLTGASGQLGAWVLREALRQGHDVIPWCASHQTPILGIAPQVVDLTRSDDVRTAFAFARPDAVIHCAALATVAACRRDPELADRTNVQATAQLVELAAERRIPLQLVSTDLVFDGERGWYGEEDAPQPLWVYGRTKVAAERVVRAYADGTVVRVSLLFGPSLVGRASFFDQQVAALRQQQPIKLFVDEWRTPASLLTAARALLAVSTSGFAGLLHVGGPERLSRYEMGQRLAQHLALDAAVLVGVERNAVPGDEPRPRDVSLQTTLFKTLFPAVPFPVWDEALREMGSA